MSPLSPKGSRRAYVMERLTAGKMTRVQAAELLGINQCAGQRLKQSFAKEMR